METYLARITPNVSNIWRTDELHLKVKGNLKYLYAITGRAFGLRNRSQTPKI